ncbi:efflux RND transporter periplasmic adaptor subunit [Flavobacterium sp. MC2016-06]|uniref:efflux RND transporter periplasmic adaptor subunit n=1 Tax=Flavobacterium sp. MC2016-06 TaxID=2676308 RepID=UPI0012BAAD11|nr:efflux RND transporter periplasmic adaptor subunit [Flavobacterium sp. MC2016-06]MBU3857527.1 efflux RND transporter periplasmic adaptor subunit [Flavobacterium sp. MC2016-06]
MKKIFMILSLCALFLYTSCNSKKEEIKEEKTKFLVTTPIERDTTITKEYVSQIHSIQHIELRAQERGYLEKIYVDEGQTVKKGQLLFKIMPTLYEAELKKAKAEVSFTEIEYKNTKRLSDGNVVSPNELAMAKAKLEKANAEMALSQIHLKFTEIRAPFDGVIDKFHVRQGSLVDEGELLTELADNSSMWVYYNVPESEYLDYESQAGKVSKMKVNLLMANNQRFPYSGIVETIEGDFDNETGNIPFRATFPNPKKLLRHGETGSIEMPVELKNAMLIPQKATFEVLDKKYVYVIDKDNAVKSREVVVAAEMPHLFVIKEGLKTTDKILLEGLRLVKENDKIEYQVVKPEAVLSNLELYAE